MHIRIHYRPDKDTSYCIYSKLSQYLCCYIIHKYEFCMRHQVRETKRATHHGCLYLLFTLEVISKWILLQLRPVFSFFFRPSVSAQLKHSCKSTLSLLVPYRISKALQRIPRNRWILFLIYTYSIFTDAVTGGREGMHCVLNHEL